MLKKSFYLVLKDIRNYVRQYNMLFTVMFVLEVHLQSPTAKLKSAGKDVVLFVLLLLLIILDESIQLLTLPLCRLFFIYNFENKMLTT